jgi:hypothetical protein
VLRHLTLVLLTPRETSMTRTGVLSSHRYRSGDTLGAAQSTPKLEKRQTAPPANIKALKKRWANG